MLRLFYRTRSCLLPWYKIHTDTTATAAVVLHHYQSRKAPWRIVPGGVSSCVHTVPKTLTQLVLLIVYLVYLYVIRVQYGIAVYGCSKLANGTCVTSAFVVCRGHIGGNYEYVGNFWDSDL